MLNEKVALITGGTRGIGYATVKKFLNEGATVIFTGSSDTSVSKALKNLDDAGYKEGFEGIYPDLTNIKQVRDAIDAIVKKYGKIDILINNAGVSSSSSIYLYEDKDYEDVMDINFKAVFNTSKCVSEHMKNNDGGVILNISSVVSLYGQTSGSLYPASKFAVNGLTKSLARELGKDKIRVNAVAPGVIHTDMVDALPEEIVNGLLSTIPLGRLGEPEDIANTLAFLASDNASYITGAVISVDGAVQI